MFASTVARGAPSQAQNRGPKQPETAARASTLVDRWRLTVDLFSRVFTDDVAQEPGSLLRQLASGGGGGGGGVFQLKEAKFRREMERVRNSSHSSSSSSRSGGELLLEVDRDRNRLLAATFRALNSMYARRIANGCGTPSSSSSVTAAITTSTAATASAPLPPPPLCLSRVKVCTNIIAR